MAPNRTCVYLEGMARIPPQEPAPADDVREGLLFSRTAA
jgi:hypothetical protein